MRISVELFDGVEDGLHGSVVCETLEDDAQLHLGILPGRVRTDGRALAGALVLDLGSVSLVFGSHVEEELDCLGVVIVLLLFNNDLCEYQSVNILIFAICVLDLLFKR